MLVFTLLGIVTYGQSSYLKHIKATVANEKIFISWTTKAGFTCQDIFIELGKDSLKFKKVGAIYGWCGVTTEKDYGFVIDSPFYNQLNFVRIKLGDIGYSEIVQLRVISVRNKVAVIPHPANANTELFFNNPFHKQTTITFYNSNGQIIHTLETSKSSILLGEYLTNSSLYLYILEQEGEPPIVGKLVYQQL